MEVNQVQVDREKFYSVIGPLDVCLFSNIKVENEKEVITTTFKLRHSDKEIGRSVNGVYFLDSKVA
ncbi:hypothetical protein ABEF86_16570 (plasmid) [Acinetobacter thermotolerans]|uniref:hypothetical protein n=1 Tax=Acinetobacter thermotolerans TaxID=3151487 RepID=UPI00325B4C0B